MKICRIGVLALLVVFSGCGGLIVQDLNYVGDAASVAEITATALQATGVISQQVAQVVITTAQQAATAVSQSITEVESSDPNPIKITKVSAYFAAVVINGAGLPPQALTLVNAISAAIQVLLSQLNSQTVVTAAQSAPRSNLSLVLTNRDRLALGTIKAKADQTYKAAGEWLAGHH
jgi:hypothetical protein